MKLKEGTDNRRENQRRWQAEARAEGEADESARWITEAQRSPRDES